MFLVPKKLIGPSGCLKGGRNLLFYFQKYFVTKLCPRGIETGRNVIVLFQKYFVTKLCPRGIKVVRSASQPIKIIEENFGQIPQ